MQVVGFDFVKIFVEKKESFSQPSINTNIEFVDLEKEKVEILKDKDAAKIKFVYSVSYLKQKDKKDEKIGEILLEGHIVMTMEKDESAKLFKAWKKKEVAQNIQLPLFNLILKKCTPKSVAMADEINLPSPIPFPKIKPKTD